MSRKQSYSEKMDRLWSNPEIRDKMLAGGKKGQQAYSEMSKGDLDLLRLRTARTNLRRRKVLEQGSGKL